MAMAGRVAALETKVKDLMEAGQRSAICRNARVKYSACQCTIDGRDCDGRGTWTHHGNEGLEYSHPCERYGKQQAVG